MDRPPRTYPPWRLPIFDGQPTKWLAHYRNLLICLLTVQPWHVIRADCLPAAHPVGAIDDNDDLPLTDSVPDGAEPVRLSQMSNCACLLYVLSSLSPVICEQFAVRTNLASTLIRLLRDIYGQLSSTHGSEAICTLGAFKMHLGESVSDYITRGQFLPARYTNAAGLPLVSLSAFIHRHRRQRPLS